MKIIKVTKKNDGMSRTRAEHLWNQIEGFAAYSFNKSHAVAYSVISVWTMWVRVRYPAEYFAACMSIVKDDKLPGLVSDARDCGIEVLPPDINLSRDRYTIPDDKHILAPFSSVRGISENTALRIMELRAANRDWTVVKVKKKRDGTLEEVWGFDPEAAAKGRFDTVKEFEMASAQVGSKVNFRCVENLGLVGAFVSIDPGAKSALHFERRKDQTELMPGLIIDAIKSDRVTDAGDPFLRAKIISAVQDYKKCKDCSLAGTPHPTVRLKTVVKFMVVSDSPSWQEEKADKLLEGEAALYIKNAIKSAGLSVSDGYYTTLVKAKKNGKFLTNEQLNGCRKHIERELEVIKPAIIIALGSASIKYFVPGIKGGTAELVGKAIYDSKLDASIVCGINAQQIGFDPSKSDVLDEVFVKVASMLE